MLGFYGVKRLRDGGRLCQRIVAIGLVIPETDHIDIVGCAWESMNGHLHGIRDGPDFLALTFLGANRRPALGE
jgi:hypothetical protein